MAEYSTLLGDIDSNITTNGNKDITGQVLNIILTEMVAALGAGYQFMGPAETDTNPGTPDARVFYLATEAGTYTNFGGVPVTEPTILYYDTTWHYKAVNGDFGALLRVSDIINNLTTALATKPLSAAQGKALNDMLLTGDIFMGVAVPATNPGTLSRDYSYAWLASTAGTYTNMGGLTIGSGEIAVLRRYTGGGDIIQWEKSSLGVYATAEEMASEEERNLELLGIIQTMLPASTMMYRDTAGRWHTVDNYTANVSTGANFPTTYPDAKKVIALGTVESMPTSGDVNGWLGANTSVEEVALTISEPVYMRFAFRNCTGLKRVTLNAGCQTAFGLFQNASNLEQVDLSMTDFSQCLSLRSSFNNCSSLDYINMKGADLGRVAEATYMFSNSAPRMVLMDGATDLKATLGVNSNRLSIDCIDGIVGALYDYATNPPASYSSSTRYVVGDVVTYEDQTYICKTAIGTPHEWNANEWALTTRTLQLNSAVKTAYNAVHGTNALQSMVTAKGWTLA